MVTDGLAAEIAAAGGRKALAAADLRQGASATAHRVLDKAEALRGSLRGAASPGDELELEFGAVAAAVEGEGAPKVVDLIRGAALFLVMAERLSERLAHPQPLPLAGGER